MTAESIGPAHQQQLDVMQAALDRINAAVPESFEGDARDYIEHMELQVQGAAEAFEGQLDVLAARMGPEEDPPERARIFALVQANPHLVSSPGHECKRVLAFLDAVNATEGE